MERTKTDGLRQVADWLHAIKAPDCTHVYDDGLILVVRGSADRHILIRKHIVTLGLPFSEARSGVVSVFVLRVACAGVDLFSGLPTPAYVTRGHHDHRDEDHSTLALGLELMGMTPT